MYNSAVVLPGKISRSHSTRAPGNGINHKIGTREAKNDTRFGMGCEAGVNKQLTLFAAVDRQQKGSVAIGMTSLPTSQAALLR